MPWISIVTVTLIYCAVNGESAPVEDPTIRRCGYKLAELLHTFCREYVLSPDERK